MKVVDALPPNIKEIEEATAPHRQGIVYTYGDTIYAPGIKPGGIEDHLIAHEETHEKQQADDPKRWWKIYLENLDFRRQMEIEAYRAQWEFSRKYNRKYRRLLLSHMARDLSGPMYGNIISYERAKNIIQGVDHE